MDKNFWFYVIFGVVFVATNVAIAYRATGGKDIDLKQLAESAVYAAEQILPGKTGAEKYAFVLSQLQTITKIDEDQMSFVKILIEGAVKKFKLEAAQVVTLTAGITSEGQATADRMASDTLGRS